MASRTPSYIALHNNGELFERIERLNGILQRCEMCARKCHARRAGDEAGECGAGRELMVSSAFPHFGEEPPLAGVHGSGTIFLANCNLRCVFCQNHDISHMGAGSPVSGAEMAAFMLRLQNMGCHNINFVTPTHYAAQIVAALPEAIDGGLQLPIVWNCGGYESVEVIKLLDGIVDIYMPDIKFFSAESADRYASAPDYPSVVRRAVQEMRRQVGDLVLDDRGVAVRGLLVRHLVMPNDVAHTESVLRFVSEELSSDTYINIMEQYRPMYRAGEFDEINRRPTRPEWLDAIETAKRYGLNRGL